MSLSTVTTHEIPVRSRVRWVIVALLFWVSMSNFLDRSVFGNLAPEMPKYLHMADSVKSTDVDRYWKGHSSDVLTAVGTTRQQATGDAGTWARCQVYMKAQIAKNSWGEWY